MVFRLVLISVVPIVTALIELWWPAVVIFRWGPLLFTLGLGVFGFARGVGRVRVVLDVLLQGSLGVLDLIIQGSHWVLDLFKVLLLEYMYIYTMPNCAEVIPFFVFGQELIL